VKENKPVSNSDEISIKELLLKTQQIRRFLLGKWLIILIAGLLGSAIGLTYSLLSKPKYIAKLTFVVENEKSNQLGAYSGLANMVGVDIGGGEDLFSSDNIIELVKSRRMIENALLTPADVDGKKVTLIEQYITFRKLRKRWSKMPELTNIRYEINCNPSTFSRLQDSIVEIIYNDLIKTTLGVSKPNKKLSIIECTVTTTNELFSKLFLEELIDNVSKFYIETKTKRLKQNVDILQKRADSLSRILTSSTFSIASVTDQNLNPAKAMVTAGRSRKEIDLQVAGTVYGEVVKNLELAKVTLQKETPLIQVIDSPIYPLKKNKVGKLKGLVLGGLLASFLIITALIGKRFYQLMMHD